MHGSGPFYIELLSDKGLKRLIGALTHVGHKHTAEGEMKDSQQTVWTQMLMNAMQSSSIEGVFSDCEYNVSLVADLRMQGRSGDLPCLYPGAQRLHLRPVTPSRHRH